MTFLVIGVLALWIGSPQVGLAAPEATKVAATGTGQAFNITLTPASATNVIGSQHTVTANVRNFHGQPLGGVQLTFTVSGAHSVTGNGTTNAAGNASFTYTGTKVGTDQIKACLTDKGGVKQCSATVTKQWVLPPNKPPDCSNASPSTALLWPPNHRFEDITIQGVTDPDRDPVTIKIDRIFQDEPTNGLGDGDTSPDGAGIGTATARVRAERSGNGDGRVYHISFTAYDGKGGTCTGSVTVGVPHDQGRGNVPVDGGAIYDSTRP